MPVALHLTGRNVLVLGGDHEAVDKVQKLQRAGARVTVVAERVEEPLSQAARRGELAWFARTFVPSDLIGVHLVVLATLDRAAAEALIALKQRYPFWLCAVDQPELSDIFLVSIVQRGPVQIGISTGGGAPLLARRIRQALEGALDERFAAFAHRLALLRQQLSGLPKEARKSQLGEALAGFAMDVRVSYPDERTGRNG